MQTNLTPRVPDGPNIILLTRDLMKDLGVPDKVRDIVLAHAVTWMNPTNVVVVVYQESPPILALIVLAWQCRLRSCAGVKRA